MKKILSSGKLYVKESDISNAGRGVFALIDINKGEVIEVCPVIDISADELEILNQTTLVSYFFYYGPELNQAFIALGLGSVYNHSYVPNAVYEIKETEKLMEFKALRDIKKGEEIMVNYNREARGQTPLWFEKV